MSIRDRRIVPAAVWVAIERNPRELAITNCDLVDFEPEELEDAEIGSRPRALKEINLSNTRISDADVVKLLSVQTPARHPLAAMPAPRAFVLDCVLQSSAPYRSARAKKCASFGIHVSHDI
jgi:hypothetical protein